MKKVLLMCLMALFIQSGAYAQAAEIIQLGLNIEKLAQLRGILRNMKRGYEVITGGYNKIKNISEGNFNIHQAFLDGLMKVSPAVKKYRKVPEIIRHQIALVNEYKGAFVRFRSSNRFSADELGYMARVYEHLLLSSLKNLDELTIILTAGKLRMSDDERLQAIDRIHAEMEDKLLFLRHFNGNASVLALQRAKAQQDITGMEVLYDYNP